MDQQEFQVVLHRGTGAMRDLDEWAAGGPPHSWEWLCAGFSNFNAGPAVAPQRAALDGQLEPSGGADWLVSRVARREFLASWPSCWVAGASPRGGGVLYSEARGSIQCALRCWH
jgi:hypothetical protein